MKEQPIHTQHHVIFYTKATSVNSWWLDNSCVIATKDDPSCYVIFNHIDSTFFFSISEKFQIEINYCKIKIALRKT
jgi:hypothetical protein